MKRNEMMMMMLVLFPTLANVCVSVCNYVCECVTDQFAATLMYSVVFVVR